MFRPEEICITLRSTSDLLLEIKWQWWILKAANSVYYRIICLMWNRGSVSLPDVSQQSRWVWRCGWKYSSHYFTQQLISAFCETFNGTWGIRRSCERASVACWQLRHGVWRKSNRRFRVKGPGRSSACGASAHVYLAACGWRWWLPPRSTARGLA